MEEVGVATDAGRIASAVEAAGVRALMTDPACRNGTERIAQAARDLPADGDLNVQGGEPLIDPRALTPGGELLRSGGGEGTLGPPPGPGGGARAEGVRG